MAGGANMPQATKKLDLGHTSGPTQRSRITDTTNHHTYYLGTPGTTIVGYAAYVENSERIHGPNFRQMFSEPQLLNVRTGQIGERTHHCGHKESHNHKPGPDCIRKGHYTFCCEFKTVNKRRVRCGKRYLICSRKGCPECGNRPGTIAKMIEDLHERHIEKIDWEFFNDPQRNAILKHQENSEKFDAAKIQSENDKKVDDWYNSPQAETEEPPAHILKSWAPFVQATVTTQQQSRVDKVRAKRIDTLAKEKVEEATQRTMATKKTHKKQAEDPVADAKLQQDALESAMAEVIAEDHEAQQPVVPLSVAAQAKLNRRRNMEERFAPGGSGTSKPKGGNKKPSSSVQEHLTGKKDKKGRKPKRDQENQPPA